MTAREVYEQWLTDPGIDEATKAELLKIEGDDKEIEDRFYRELEFGTAGLRGVLGAGTNRMNKYVVAKATQGLADYINKFYDSCGAAENFAKDESVADAASAVTCKLAPLPGRQSPPEKAVAIACDSRIMSMEFAEISAACLNANGIKAYVFDSLRPTPELSFAVRYFNCIAGINITASHNPREYNGYKVYWADGAQVTPPHDTGIMACVEAVTNLSNPKLMPKEEAEARGLFVQIGKDVDEVYIGEILKTLKSPGTIPAANLKIAYTPLHGAGIAIVPDALKAAGFKNVFVEPAQAIPDGNFPTLDVPNPELKSAFELADRLGKEKDADIILATDPDSDRIGIHVKDKEGAYHDLNGNMIGCLLAEYEFSRLKEAAALPSDAMLVRTIVSSKLVDKIADFYGAAVKAVLTGFKYIGQVILNNEEAGRGSFIMGFEESYGYLIGTHARDKDACVAALALSEAAAYYKTLGKTLWDALMDIYAKYGFALEETISVTKKGKDGAAEIAAIMTNLRENPPKAFGAYEITGVKDYNDSASTGLPKSNVLYYDLKDAWVCVRPSGTEPKIKYYIGVTEKDEASARAKIEALKAAL